MTFYRSADDLPPFKDYGMAGRTYRYFRGQPLYPLGYGLSYTRFSYDAARLSHARIRTNGSATVTVRVRNLGDRDGAEVVQLYLSRRNHRAVRVLRGFQRVQLKRGESRDVAFNLDGESLSTLDSAGQRQVRPG